MTSNEPADMEVALPAESDAAVVATDSKESSVRADQLLSESFPSGVESETDCAALPEQSGILDKDGDQSPLADNIANSEASSRFSVVRDGSTEPSADHKASQLSELESAEITLVVEVSTEMAQDVVNRDDGTDGNSSMNAPELGWKEDCETGVFPTNSAAHELEESAAHELEETLDRTQNNETNPPETADKSSLQVHGLTAEEVFKEEVLRSTEGRLNAERKKGLIEAGIAVQVNEQVALEMQSASCGTDMNKNSNIAEDSKTDSSVRTTVQIMEHNLESKLVPQTEPIRERIDMPSEVVQKGPIKGELGRYPYQEETEHVRGSAPTAVGDKNVRNVGVESQVGLNFYTGLVYRRGFVVGSRIEERTPELSIKSDPGSAEKGPMQSCHEMESDWGSGVNPHTIEGEKSPNSHLAEKDEINVSGCQVEGFQNKESISEVKAGEEVQARPDSFGQEAQVSASGPGSLKHSRFENGEADCADMPQLATQLNRNTQAEVQSRVTKTPHEGLQGSYERSSRELFFADSREEGEACASMGQHWHVGIEVKVKSKMSTSLNDQAEGHKDSFANNVVEGHQEWHFPGTSYEIAEQPSRVYGFEEEKMGVSDEANAATSEEERYFGGQLETLENAGQKRKLSDNPLTDSCGEPGQNETLVKKAKKKAINVWSKTTSRKGPKKNNRNGSSQNLSTEDSVLLTPVYVNPDKVEDGPDQFIVLSKYDKAEKIELSENRLAASSTKGYRMVRATRGVQEGTWYYEIIVEQLGPTGHTRLGWSTQKGDVQAPVGFDSNSYGYRDMDGSKTHVAVREPYGDLYVEGDVIGFYIHLPNGAEYAPKPASLLSHRGRGPYLPDVKEELPIQIPGSEICFFRNGVCQGTAFKDIYGGRYFPAASMYTLPKEPSCTVKFNFGPDFRYPPMDLDGRPAPMAMFHAPYHNALNGHEVGPVACANVCTTEINVQNMEPQMKLM